MEKLVIALGGNALGNTAAEQLHLVTETAKSIVDLIAAGNEVVVAHGNGPQVCPLPLRPKLSRLTCRSPSAVLCPRVTSAITCSRLSAMS